MNKKQFYDIRNQAGATPVIFIDGIIGGDADYTSFRNALLNLLDTGVKRVKLCINSGGGSMMQGFAFYDLLKSRKGLTIEVEVIGMAASMAVPLMLAASPGLLGIHKHASAMTHKAFMVAAGSSDELRDTAEYGDKLEAKAKAIVCERTGKKEDEIKDWFSPGRDKWFTAQEAVIAGLCDYEIPHADDDKEPVQRPASGFKSEAEAYGFYNQFSPKKDIKNQKHTMKKVIAMLGAMSVQHNLTDECTEDQVAAVFQNALTAKDNRIKELEDSLKANNKEKATALVENAIAAGKVKAESKDTFINQATDNYDGVKAMFDGLVGRVDIKNEIQLGGEKDKDKKVEATDGKTYRQHSEKELAAMRTKDPDKFKALFKAEYGVDYTD